ncbi:MAG TPA: glycosyltransferase family 1 protein [Acidimicrobiales bacterium]|nr:glycosyltransferase family 1 protein [Acidimicrobiales bacterium]
MRVALDVSAVPAQLTGAGRYVVEIAKRLAHSGPDVTLVSRRGDEERWRAWSGAPVVGLVPTGRATRLWYEAWRLGTSEVARGVDVWHGPHYTMPHRGATPSVVTIHDLTFFTHPQWHERAKVAYFQRAIRYSAANAAALIAVSDATARLIDELLPGHAPVVIAPHGVDLTAFSLVDVDDAVTFERAGLAGDAAYVLFVGTLEPRKGLDVLIEAFDQVARDRPELELWIAGKAGWGETPEVVRRAGSRQRIRRLGYVDQAVLPALMRRARCVAYPSWAEGFGLPVLEALACGGVVVTSAGTVMEEVAGGHALLAEAGDVASLAAALVAANDLDAGARAARAPDARRHAERYTWEASIARHLEAYDLAARA